LNPELVDSLNLKSTTGVLVDEVELGTAADKAGMKTGDIILRFDGVELTSDGQFAYLIRANPPGTNVEIDLLRNQETLTLEATLGKRPSGPQIYFLGSFIKGSASKVFWTLHLPLLILALFLLVVGALIGWLRPKDSVAFQCSILFLCLGLISFQGLSPPLLAFWPSWALLVSICFSEVSFGLWVPLTLRVLSIFPNPSRLGKLFLKWQWLAFLYFGFYSFSWCAYHLTKIFGWKPNWVITNPVAQFIFNLNEWLILPIIVLMGSLLISQRIETRDRPQARLKVIEFGLVLGTLGLLLYLGFPLAFAIAPQFLRPVWGYLAYYLPVALLSAIPISFAYSILARKVFGIRFILRKGLQHLLLSKGALLLEGIIIFFIVWQVVGKGGSRLAGSPITVSGVAVASAVLVMGTLSRVNRKIMPVIDRRFFRETLDVRHLLLELGDQLSELREREKILKRTASTVLKALHPLRVVLLLKEAQTKDIKCVLDLKNGTSRLASIEDLEKEAVSIPSLELKSEDPAIQQLQQGKSWLAVYPEKLDSENEQERRLLELNCELLILLQGSSGLIGVMGLGAKLSEEPFSGEDRELLLTVARQMGMALENAELLEVAKREAQFARDLEIAKQVQQNLFPKKLPAVPGWEFAGICRSARAVGGDYYDIFEVAPGKVLLALGDVSGKGLGASLLMASVHSAIRSRAVTSLDDPSKLIVELNRHLLSSTSPETFVTLFLGLIDLEPGKLQYVNCGHPPPVLMRKEERKMERLAEGGPILGILDGDVYTHGECQLNTGDILILFSDGVTEAMNNQEEMFEEERLLKVLNDTTILEASAIMDMILKSVDSFTAGCEQADDISVVVVRRWSRGHIENR
jgi:sigma-B regulation protein RsbU (phosphoserine phosphatase)